MSILAIIATLASTMTGLPCVGIDNGTNRAVFAVPGQPTLTRAYVDYGDNLGYSDIVPKPAWPAVNAAEAALRHGKPGRKVHLACYR